MAGFEQFEIADPASGRPAVRNGLTVAFFMRRFVHEASGALQSVFDDFLGWLPAGSMRWAIPNATTEEWRPVSPDLLKRCRESIAPPGSRKRSLTAFEINDSGAEPAQFKFLLNGREVGDESPEETTLVEMNLPISYAEESTVEALVARVGRWSEQLQPCTGYAAAALIPGDADVGISYGLLRGQAMRHPGYDVAVNEMTSVGLGDQLRTVQWLTILGPASIERLGGMETLRGALPPSAGLTATGPGVMIRATRLPELGDVNRNDRVPALRALASLLEPVTLFEDPDMLSYFAGFDEELLRNWERRFLLP